MNIRLETTSFSRLLSLVYLAASLLLVSGCGKDKTLDQYHQEKVTADLSRLQAISGQYRGTIVNQRDNSSMGNLEIDLTASLVPTNSTNGTTNSSLAVLQGGLTLINAFQSTAALQSAQYYSDDNSDHGTFSGTIVIPTAKSGNATLSISGTIAGNTITGIITPSDRSGPSGTFTATKGAPFPHNGQPQTNPGSTDGTLVYVGSYKDTICDGRNHDSNLCRGNNGIVNVRMGVNLTAPTVAETFLNNFVDQKTVGVQLSFGDQAIASLPNAELDQKVGTLRFKDFIQGSISSLVTLMCQTTNATNHCTFTSGSFGATYTFDLTQQRNNSNRTH